MKSCIPLTKHSRKSAKIFILNNHKNRRSTLLVYSTSFPLLGSVGTKFENFSIICLSRVSCTQKIAKNTSRTSGFGSRLNGHSKFAQAYYGLSIKRKLVCVIAHNYNSTLKASKQARFVSQNNWLRGSNAIPFSLGNAI